ncbi:cobalamin biosynthesis protein [Nocardia mangyaensis]|uniref:cobalamin biosynthesis protein n=1 Tax=Nocardia mangyaensis TaxID=2213200 RepID=UPI001F0B3038|nr:cobalamin biosynthesis protein [Nocardia mangyaensis]
MTSTGSALLSSGRDHRGPRTPQADVPRSSGGAAPRPASGRIAVAIGIGVRPGTESARIVRAVDAVVGQTAVVCLATIDRRAAEDGVRGAAATLGVPLIGFTAEQLAQVDVRHSSERTSAAVGAPSVAEAAALLAGGGELICGRTIVEGIVVATAAMIRREEGPN